MDRKKAGWIVVCEAPFLKGDDGGRREHLGIVTALANAKRIACLVVCGPSRDEEGAYSLAAGHAPVLILPRTYGVQAFVSPMQPYVWASRRPTKAFWTQWAALGIDASGVLAASFKSAGLAKRIAERHRLPLVIRQHNLEDEYYRDVGRASRGLRAFYYSIESRRIRRAEYRLMRSPFLSGVAEISPVDQSRRLTADPRTASRLVPPFAIEPSSAPELVSRQRRPAGSIAYLGALDITINQEGLRWFFSEVWPQVLDARPLSRILIAGRRPDNEFDLFLKQQPATDTLYDVPSTAEVLSRSAIAINPSVSGSGVNIKLVEYLAHGCAVVTTKRAADTLPPLCDGVMVVAAENDTFAARLVELLDSPNMVAQVGSAGREAVLRTFDRRALVAELEILMNCSRGR